MRLRSPCNGDAAGFECEILELDPYTRIVFNWGYVGPDRLDGPTFDSRRTLTFTEERDGTTTLTLVREHLDDLYAAMPGVADNVGPGGLMFSTSSPRSLTPAGGHATRRRRICAL
ncbi:SRPBCC domain-containing protein [Arthrobacter sp. UYEF20]|uniref:SRPBCC family protein n=1 Tax=Arthrobacter sp. UYEF20 TaxID=1756363 RepID=UPI00339933BC